jgi:hypothetical protein
MVLSKMGYIVFLAAFVYSTFVTTAVRAAHSVGSNNAGAAAVASSSSSGAVARSNSLADPHQTQNGASNNNDEGLPRTLVSYVPNVNGDISVQITVRSNEIQHSVPAGVRSSGILEIVNTVRDG